MIVYYIIVHYIKVSLRTQWNDTATQRVRVQVPAT